MDAFTTSILDDYTIFDGQQTIILADTEGAQTQISGVTSGALSQKQAALVGGLVGIEDETQSFSIAINALGSVRPQQGWTIWDEDDVLWNILALDQKTLSTRYQAVCVKSRSLDRRFLRFAYDGAYTSGAIATGKIALGAADQLRFSKTTADGVLLYFVESDADSGVYAFYLPSATAYGITLTNQDGVVWPGDGITAVASDKNLSEGGGGAINYLSLQVAKDVGGNPPALSTKFTTGDTLTMRLFKP